MPLSLRDILKSFGIKPDAEAARLAAELQATGPPVEIMRRGAVVAMAQAQQIEAELSKNNRERPVWPLADNQAEGDCVSSPYVSAGELAQMAQAYANARRHFGQEFVGEFPPETMPRRRPPAAPITPNGSTEAQELAERLERQAGRVLNQTPPASRRRAASERHRQAMEQQVRQVVGYLADGPAAHSPVYLNEQGQLYSDHTGLTTDSEGRVHVRLIGELAQQTGAWEIAVPVLSNPTLNPNTYLPEWRNPQQRILPAVVQQPPTPPPAVPSLPMPPLESVPVPSATGGRKLIRKPRSQ